MKAQYIGLSADQVFERLGTLGSCPLCEGGVIFRIDRFAKSWKCTTGKLQAHEHNLRELIKDMMKHAEPAVNEFGPVSP